MKIPLSQRLEACADFVEPGARVGDIGCDHGYLGIRLLHTGKASFVHACDLREQPLQKARANALRFDEADKMRFSLADGLKALDPQEIDTIICAGMGGDLVIKILEESPWVKNPAYRLILQPQTSGNVLRRSLTQMGFGIEKETLARDGGFIYYIMQLRYGLSQCLSPGEEYCSPQLLKSGSELLPAYLDRIAKSLAITVEGISRAEDPESRNLSYYETALREITAMQNKEEKQ